MTFLIKDKEYWKSKNQFEIRQKKKKIKKKFDTQPINI